MKEPVIHRTDGGVVAFSAAPRFLLAQVAYGIAMPRYPDDGYDETEISRAIARRLIRE